VEAVGKRGNQAAILMGRGGEAVKQDKLRRANAARLAVKHFDAVNFESSEQHDQAYVGVAR
jgi:hypothetical protein